ncbi:MAG: uroporphyrinogen decarboxylase family protein [Spirochaetaceae bacterium]|nr:uroporphyrinogen decarboxylase family protein [Spirochaetaceae bacterium]
MIESIRRSGAFTIKHTDGNIMPILDQLAECRPHGLHSLDPRAGVDIKKVKALIGGEICLCGNVHCAALQTGTLEEVRESAEYCLTWGKPGGGYIFCTSNIPFKGMPAERYTFILDLWKRMRDYKAREDL